MFGLKIVVSAQQCDLRFVRWVRTHRNNRIARKWHKRYGAVRECRSVGVVRAGDMLFACPHVGRRLTAALAEVPSDGTYTARHLAFQAYSPAGV